MTDRLTDPNKQTEKRFTVSQPDQSDFSHVPNLAGNRQEKQEGDSLLLARAGTFNPSRGRLRPSLPPDAFQRLPEMPTRKSFHSSIPNTFQCLETAHDGRIGKSGFVLLKNTDMLFYTHRHENNCFFSRSHPA